MPAIVYVEEYLAKACEEHPADETHVVGTAVDGARLKLTVAPGQVPPPGSAGREAFLADPPVDRDVTDESRQSCCGWEYIRDL